MNSVLALVGVSMVCALFIVGALASYKSRGAERLGGDRAKDAITVHANAMAAITSLSERAVTAMVLCASGYARADEASRNMP